MKHRWRVDHEKRAETLTWYCWKCFSAMQRLWTLHVLSCSFSRGGTLWPRSCWGGWPGRAPCTSSPQTSTPNASSDSPWPHSSPRQRTSLTTGASSPKLLPLFWLRRKLRMMQASQNQGKVRWQARSETKTPTQPPGPRRGRRLHPGWTRLKWSCGLTRHGINLGDQCALLAATASLCLTIPLFRRLATTVKQGLVLKMLQVPSQRHPQGPILWSRLRMCLQIFRVNRTWKSWQSSTACPVSASRGCSVASTRCAALWRCHKNSSTRTLDLHLQKNKLYVFTSRGQQSSLSYSYWKPPLHRS